MSYYQYHIFFCCNQREDGEMCCNQHGARPMRDYMKQRIYDLGSRIPGKVRVNLAGCMNRCAEGPLLVIYPQAVWYTYTGKEDIDEIIEQHIVAGHTVDRLTI